MFHLCFIVIQAQKTQKPPQKPAAAVTSVTPVVKDPLVKKPEIKLKTETAGSFQAFKRTEVKVSPEEQSSKPSPVLKPIIRFMRLMYADVVFI